MKVGDVAIFDYAHPPGYDEAGPEERAALDEAWRASEEAHTAYLEAFQAAGCRQGARGVRNRWNKYSAAYARYSRARAALTDPVCRAVEVLLAIGTNGLDDSRREEVRALAVAAKAALDERPLV